MRRWGQVLQLASSTFMATQTFTKPSQVAMVLSHSATTVPLIDHLLKAWAPNMAKCITMMASVTDPHCRVASDTKIHRASIGGPLCWRVPAGSRHTHQCHTCPGQHTTCHHLAGGLHWSHGREKEADEVSWLTSHHPCQTLLWGGNNKTQYPWINVGMTREEFGDWSNTTWQNDGTDN